MNDYNLQASTPYYHKPNCCWMLHKQINFLPVFWKIRTSLCIQSNFVVQTWYTEIFDKYLKAMHASLVKGHPLEALYCHQIRTQIEPWFLKVMLTTIHRKDKCVRVERWGLHWCTSCSGCWFKSQWHHETFMHAQKSLWVSWLGSIDKLLNTLQIETTAENVFNLISVISITGWYHSHNTDNTILSTTYARLDCKLNWLKWGEFNPKFPQQSQGSTSYVMWLFQDMLHSTTYHINKFLVNLLFFHYWQNVFAGQIWSMGHSLEILI